MIRLCIKSQAKQSRVKEGNASDQAMYQDRAKPSNQELKKGMLVIRICIKSLGPESAEGRM